MFFENKEVGYEMIYRKIVENNIPCMREMYYDRRSGKVVKGKIIGVSLTEEGLRGVANKSGRYLYSGAMSLNDAYKMPKTKNIIVEKFIPSKFPSKEEILWLDKAWRLISLR